MADEYQEQHRQEIAENEREMLELEVYFPEEYKVCFQQLALVQQQQE